jgi:dTDP-4-amino-4,6-dideoxygalactose transaminase
VAPTVRAGCRHVYHQYTVRIPDRRDEVARQINAAGVATSIHYPMPVHRQPLYAGLGYRETLPIAERASREVLSLPAHPGLSRRELATVGRVVGAALEVSAGADTGDAAAARVA